MSIERAYRGESTGSLTEPHKHAMIIEHRDGYCFELRYGDQHADLNLLLPNPFFLNYRLNRLGRKMIRKHDRAVKMNKGGNAFAERIGKGMQP